MVIEQGDSDGPDTDDPAVVRVRDELDRLGWSQRMLADRTLVGESTIFRLLRGQYSRKTLLKVKKALGLDDSARVAATNGIAATELGGYSREIFAHYEGAYRCVRPTFTGTREVITYPFDITWDDDRPGLVFRDHNPGYMQSGDVMVPPGSTIVHFVTIDRGSARLITAYHITFRQTDIRGVILTIANPSGRDLYPAAGPIVLARVRDDDDPIGQLNGRVPRDDPRLARVRPMLDEMDFAPGMLKG